MGRGGAEQENPPVPARRAPEAEHLEWIRANFGTDRQLAPGFFTSGSLTVEHGPCPDEVNPLVDLPHEIDELEPEEQLEALDAAYGRDVIRGLGLQLVIFSTAEEAWQWRLRETVERELAEERQRQSDVDLVTLAMRQWELYRAREAQLHWACQRLGWPSDWTLAYLRMRGAERFDYGPCRRMSEKPSETPFPQPDPEREVELWQQHGLCPEDVDPLIDLPERIGEMSRSEQLVEIEKAYGDLAERMVAFEDFISGSDTELARSFAEELRAAQEERLESSSEALKHLMRLAQAREAQLVWAAQALGFAPSALIAYLTARVSARR